MKLRTAFEILEAIPSPYWYDPNFKMKCSVRDPYWNELLEAGLVEQDGAHCYRTEKGDNLLSYRPIRRVQFGTIPTEDDNIRFPEDEYILCDDIDLKDGLRVMKLLDMLRDVRVTAYLDRFGDDLDDDDLDESDFLHEGGPVGIDQIPDEVRKDIKKKCSKRCCCCKKNKKKSEKEYDEEGGDKFLRFFLKNLRDKLKESEGMKFEMPDGSFGYRIVFEDTDDE